MLVLSQEDFGAEPDSSAEWDELDDGDTHQSMGDLDSVHGASSSSPPPETPSPPPETPQSKSSCSHHFAAEGDNMQSKMAFAYKYMRQDGMFEKAINLYTDLTEVVVNNFLISKDSPVIEPVRLHNGAEENKEALKKSKGEEDEDFQILEYQAQKGNVVAMYKVGLFYYFGG
ncbi:ERAD-associated E3 ubiquitin-protein ligase component [Vigna angularis]|uniref:ERAD-associated E3 ubiquitin-protein ligase component n=1 Tax=Phaseolus angularis TaxID=3914 RepID=A0A8T0KLF7_PHAAN|nr:ERAD-associated E3 ubiquitin-protein ligase component [Vigna angularis]